MKGRPWWAAARLLLASEPGKETRVEARVPLED